MCHSLSQVGCSKIVRPVCASNGLTYANECLLRQIVCKYDLQDLTVVKRGRCDEPEEDEDKQAEAWCPPGLCSRLEC